MRFVTVILYVSNATVCEDDNREDKVAIIADIDQEPWDIEPNIKAVMQLGIEHFKVIVKQLGRSAWG